MKKLVLVVLILSVLAGSAFAQQWWTVTNRDGGKPAENNTFTMRNGYIYFNLDSELGSPVPGKDFDTLRVTFHVTEPINIYWNGASQPGSMWGSHRGGRDKEKGFWHYNGVSGDVVIETDMSSFTNSWFGGTRVPYEKRNTTAFTIQVEAAKAATYTFKNVEFIGLKD